MNKLNTNEKAETKPLLADVIPDNVISFMNDRKFYYDNRRMEYYTSDSIAKLLINFGNLVSKKTIEKCRKNIDTVDLEDFSFDLNRDL